MKHTTFKYINFSIDLHYKNLLEESGFNFEIINQTSEILNTSKSALIYKTTRAGFTTSSLISAKLLGKKVLIVEPTHGIRENTINKVPGLKHVSILPNKKCLRLMKKFAEDPELEKLFYSLPGCDECSLNENCEVTEFLRSTDYDVVSVTYKKIEALILSNSKLSNKILDKLNNEIDIIILDEAHILNYSDNIKINYNFNPSEVFKTKENLRVICNRWDDLKEAVLDLNPWFGETNLDILSQKLSKGKSSQTLALQTYSPLDLSSIIRKYSHKELLELAESRDSIDVSMVEIEKFRDLINFFDNNLGIYVLQIIGEETLISGVGNNYMSDFIKKVPNINQIFITSSTLFEKKKGFFSDMVGETLKEITFKDLRNTDEKVTIKPSKYNLDYRDERVFDNLLRDAKAVLNKVKDVYLVAVNKKLASRIQHQLNKDGYPVKVDYYRSPHSLGVGNSNRVCIAFGLAEVPVNTFDAECINSNDPLIESRRLRYDYVLSATWQAWSRVKDPEGLTPSTIYALGVRSNEIQNVIAWGKNRTSKPKISTVKTPDGELQSYKFKIEVKEPVGLPKVEMEPKSKEYQKPHKLKVSDFIAGFKPANKDYWLLNDAKNIEDLERNCEILNRNFCHRKNPVAVQQTVGPKNPYYPDYKINLVKDDQPIMDHLEGKTTLGTYFIRPEGTAAVGCFDIDRHKKEDPPTEPILRKLFNVLDKYKIEYLIEGSGSPESYHIWIFIVKTNALTINKFLTVILKEADIKCEIFPPQKRLGREKPLGSLVKLPLGINKKNGKRSKFLNPETLEPIDGKIKLPSFVVLNEIPDEKLTEEKVNFFRKYENNKMRPCFTKALSDGLSFTGSAGHRFRLALAIEALYSGLEVDQIVKLFEPQPDFDEKITRDQIIHAMKAGYKPFKCSTLQADCADFIICENCGK